MRLDNVLYVPKLKSNILSLGQFDEHECRILREGGFLTIYDQCGRLITCIFNLNSYLIQLIFMLILCNYDACYLSFMNFLNWYAILLKSMFMHYLGLIMCFMNVKSFTRFNK